jgi:hypothetical protein
MNLVGLSLANRVSLSLLPTANCILPTAFVRPYPRPQNDIRGECPWKLSRPSRFPKTPTFR